ncbi:hypothetical protein ACHAWO_005586 [Cyclotella atomus]|uniref:PDZ domain-containing protein n=1 Tax=Cyclotella atomus TaxID=382360 RepID=A0ABD3QS95_9STRA
MNNHRGGYRSYMSKALVSLVGLLALSTTNATSEVKAQTRANDVVADSWAQDQDILSEILGRVNAVPSVEPSYDPTRSPTATPSTMPSVSSVPTAIPSVSPSVSMEPTISPTSSPSLSAVPSSAPSGAPSSSPTEYPTASPSLSTMPSANPTSSPSVSSEPSSTPTESPTSVPSESPSEQPTADPTKSPTSSPSKTPTGSPTLAPTTSNMPSTTPTVAKTLKKDMYLIDGSSTRSTSLLIIGACAFVAVASTGVYLYRRNVASSERQNYGYAAPITEVSADKDFEDGAGVISPMSRVSGLPRFSYDPNENKPKRQKCDDDTDVELGEIPRSVYVSTPNTSVAVSAESKENAIIRGVQKYFQTGKTKGSKPSSKKGMSWNEIRDEGSPACSSGVAPASVPSMFSPVPVRGMPALLENRTTGSNSSDRTDTESLGMKKVESETSLALVKSGSADSYSRARMIVKSGSASYNSAQLDAKSSRSNESYIQINKSGSVESNSSSKYANIVKSTSAYSNATKSIKSKNSFFPLSDDNSSNDEEAAKSIKSIGTKSVKSNATKSVRSYGSSKSGSVNDGPSFEDNVSEIKNILKSISGEQPSELYTSESKESREKDVPMSYSTTPPDLSPQASEDHSFAEKADVIRSNDQITPQSEDFAFDANFDNVTLQTAGSGSYKDKETPREHCAQLLSPITYEKELQTSVSCQEFSFRNLLSDPNNELYECHAPPGPLGIVIDSTPLGPRVKSLNPMSSLFNTMSPGDIIVGIDDIDTVGMEAAEFWQLVSRKANQRKRILTMLKI